MLLLASCAVLASGAGRKEPIPLFFLENHGQAAAPVRFMVKASGLTAYFSTGETLFRVSGHTLHMRFEGVARTSFPEATTASPAWRISLPGRRSGGCLRSLCLGGSYIAASIRESTWFTRPLDKT